MEERGKNEAARLTEKAVKGLLSTKEGCFFLGLLLSRSGVDEPSLDVGNIYATCANEGRRSVGIWLKNVISRYCGPGACCKCEGVYASECAAGKVRKERADDVF